MPTPEKGRSKTKFGARLSDIDIKSLAQYAKDHDLKTHTQTLSAIIAENARLHMYVAYLGDIRQVGKEAPCDLRILFQGEFYCGNRPPKATKLLTLDICKVCKKIKWQLRGLKEAEAEEPPKQEMTIDQGRETIKDPQVKHSGMVYCGDGGQWVFPQKCRSCRLPQKCRNYQAFINEST
jgi:hypothetical protein